MNLKQRLANGEPIFLSWALTEYKNTKTPKIGPFFVRKIGDSKWGVIHEDNSLVKDIHGDNYEWANVKNVFTGELIQFQNVSRKSTQ